MRKSLKVLTVLFVSLIANTNGFTSDPLSAVRVKSMGAKSFGFYLDNFKSKRIKISLRDTAGFLLHVKNIKREGVYSKQYNLDNLPIGKYMFDLEDDIKLRSYTIELSDNDLTISENKVLLGSPEKDTSDFEPFMRQHGDILDLMVFSPELAKYEIRVYNYKKKIIFSETEDEKMKIAKQYDFSKLESGVYDFVVLSDGRRFNYRMLKE